VLCLLVMVGAKWRDAAQCADFADERTDIDHSCVTPPEAAKVPSLL